jgi:hypothetical protein
MTAEATTSSKLPAAAEVEADHRHQVGQTVAKVLEVADRTVADQTVADRQVAH